MLTGKWLPTSEGIITSSYLITWLHTSLTDVIHTHVATLTLRWRYKHFPQHKKMIPFTIKYRNTQCCSTQQTMFHTHLLKSDWHFSGLKGIKNLRYKAQKYNDRELRLSSYAHHDITETVHETAVLMNCWKGQYWLQRSATCEERVNTGYWDWNWRSNETWHLQ